MTDPTNPAPPAEELREVTQSDREAAADWMSCQSYDWGFCGDIRAGRVKCDLVEAFAKHRLDHLSVLTVENERMRAALERSDKFIGNYLSPWGSWKTAWWEGEVSDEMPFADDNALRRVGEIISAALSSLPAMKGEG